MQRFILTLMLFTSSLVQSAELTQLTLGSIDQAPWGWQDQQQQLQGATIDFSKQLGERLGIHIEPQIFPYARLLKTLEKEQIDLALFLFSSRPPSVIKIEKVIEVDVQLTSSKKIKISELADLSRYRIGKIAGGKYGKGLHHRLPESHFIPLYSYQQGLELLQKNRLDAVLGLAYSINQALENHKNQPLQLYHQSLVREEVWLYASPLLNKHPNLILAIKKNIQEMRQNEELNNIVKRNYNKAKSTLIKEPSSQLLQ